MKVVVTCHGVVQCEEEASLVAKAASLAIMVVGVGRKIQETMIVAVIGEKERGEKEEDDWLWFAPQCRLHFSGGYRLCW